MSNRITIETRLAFAPELKFGQSGKAFCNLRFADQKRRKDESGQWVDASAPTWFGATVFGAEAEALAEGARKGDKVIVTGQLISREWEKDGQTRSSLEVDFATVAVVPSAPKTAGGFGQQPAAAPEPAWGGSQKQSDPWAAKSESAPF